MAASVTSPSVDAREVDFYTSLAETWWDEAGPFWPLHRLNALRIEYICDVVARRLRVTAGHAPLSGLSALDIGCGGGILSESLASRGAAVTGIDVVERNIEVARRRERETRSGVDYVLSSVEEMARGPRRFDLVFSMEVVEHVADLAGFVRACTRVANPGGLLFFATLNRTWRSYLLGIIGAEYVLGWLPRGTHRWRQFVKPLELDALVSENGMRTLETSGVRVNPLTRRFSLSPRMPINYMAVCARAPS